jgi:hypothetical protein
MEIEAATMAMKARLDFRAELAAKKRRRREVEGELLDRGIELELALARPLRQPSRDPGVKSGEIGAHRPRFESDRQHAPVQAVLVEIEQHQPAGKQFVEDDAPAKRRGKQFLRIEEHQLVGVGPSSVTFG